jgi:serine/threonine-protein kinase
LSEGRSYEIRALLGEGGFGSVYAATLRSSGGFTQTVALKVLRASVAGDEGALRRFRDEARLLGLLRHRAIVGVHSVFESEGRPVLVMELIEGAHLGVLVAMDPLPPTVALAVVAEVASALDVAQRTAGPDGRPLNLLHRDIKPSNIQLTAAGEVKVLDFGIARADLLDRQADTRSHVVGSLLYMAPERIEQIEHPGGDIYSLGLVLYECLAGEPFGRGSLQEARHRAHLERRHQRLLELGQDPAVIELLLAMVAHEPEARPAAREVERQALRLAGRLDGPLLRDWAEEAVPAARQTVTRPPPDALTGTLLTERSGSTSISGPTLVSRERSPNPPPPATLLASETVILQAPPPKEAPRAATGLVWLGGLLIAGAGVLVVAALGLFWWTGQGEPTIAEPQALGVEAAEPAPTKATTTTTKAPSPAPPSPPSNKAPMTPAPASPQPRPVQDTRSPPPTPTAAPPPAAPPAAAAPVEEAPAPPPTAEVRLAGDLAQISLRCGEQVFTLTRDGPAQTVPAGACTWSGTFPTGPLYGAFKARAGASATLRCTESFSTCD